MIDNILLIGGDSVIASALAVFFGGIGVPCRTTSRRAERSHEYCLFLDLAADVSTFKPPAGSGIAFLCAGVTSLQQCEDQPEQTFFINVQQNMVLANILCQAGYKLVYLSTSQVFDGNTTLPTPQHAVAPQTCYGQQKAVMEQALLPIDGSLIVRVSKVFTPQLPLLRQWRHSWDQGQRVRAFTDLWVAPVALEQLVQVLWALVQQNASGIWHISPHVEYSYAHVATVAARTWGYSASMVEECSAKHSMPAIFRPRHVALESSVTWAACARQAPTLSDVLQHCMDKEIVERV